MRQAVRAGRDRRRNRRLHFLALPLLFYPCAASGAAIDGDATGKAPVPDSSQASRSFLPEDFARFSPRNALDMLGQIPGFAIDEGDTNRRGLGQASANILINGERFASKSTDVLTELRRISAASVTKIEVVDGASLDVPGLTGQVANIITGSKGISGSFIWRPEFAADHRPARLTNGEASISLSQGRSEYTLSFRNDSFRHGDSGPELAFTPDGSILDRRHEVLGVRGEEPRLAGSVRRSFGDGSVLNARASLELYHLDVRETSFRSGPGQPDRVRRIHEREREHNYELGGDYEMALAGGRLKLIGLHRFEHSPFRQTATQDFTGGAPTSGQRFTRVADESESIGRGEYRWRAGPADWQISVEGAINRLDVENGLFELNGAGQFEPLPFPNAEARVEEKRAEALLTYGRPLSSNLTLQLSAGAEYSQLSQTGAGGLTRSYQRPKGFASLAWRPAHNLDASLRIEREVGQLSFLDFVATANVGGGTANSGNANLVPPQSWNGRIEATRSLGRWGTATIQTWVRQISDVVDIIPIGETGQSPGNVEGTARDYGVRWTSSFTFDPVGWRGAKLDLDLQARKTSLRDPLTGRRRAINGSTTRSIEVKFRHDLQGSDWAYGASFVQSRSSATLRLDEISRGIDTPGNLAMFVEHKDVAGLTVRASVDNLLDSNERFTRTFFDARRTGSVRFTEDRDRFRGPIFAFAVSGAI